MSNIFCIPKKIVSGSNALEGAGQEFAVLGSKALIVTDQTMQALGNVQKLEAVLDTNNVCYSIFDQVNTEPTDQIVMTGVQQYKDADCDFLIAIGGGSPIDAMKAIAVIAALGGTPVDFFGREIVADLPSMVAIPTTAGTGSEATQFTIISDTSTNVKMLLKGACLLPDIAVVDPVFTLTSPANLTAFTGLDALCHCIEAYTSRKAQPLSDTFALSAAKRIFNHLPQAYSTPDDVDARIQMSLAATEAGISFSNSSVTIIHGMSRPIGALFHVPHGLSNAMLMSGCLKFAKSGAVSRFADIAYYCGIADAKQPEEQAADALIERIYDLTALFSIPSIYEYGIDIEAFKDNIPKMAADAMKSGSPSNTIADVNAETIIGLYRALLDR